MDPHSAFDAPWLKENVELEDVRLEMVFLGWDPSS
jgi:hypothetical protein